MTALLLDLTVTGTAATLVVGCLNGLMRKKMRARWRRLWWIAIPFAFLIPFRLPILPHFSTPLSWRTSSSPLEAAPETPPAADPGGEQHGDGSNVRWLLLWGAGAAVYLGAVAAQTIRISRAWSKERLSTNPDLLDLLEDCKRAAGVTAPIGLVATHRVSTPVILGWLRPRILLPLGIEAKPAGEIQAIMLHELAHFHSLDIPTNWLFTLASALHWFNPAVHLGFRGWNRFREEAADEAAIRWMKHPTAEVYETALLNVLKEISRPPRPFGSMAIGESYSDLKQRFMMIKHLPTQALHTLLGISVALALVSAALTRPALAQQPAADEATPLKREVTREMERWLALIDNGNYAQSWKEASPFFKANVSSIQWSTAAGDARKLFGRMIGRRPLATTIVTSMPNPKGGELLKGEWVVAQFQTQFERVALAIETVTFEKTGDGGWKASGYYIKPG